MTLDGDPEPRSASHLPTAKDRRWAIVRILLGTAQIMAAAVSAYLLIQTGIGEWSLVAVGITALLVVVSKALFRGS